jgi:putative FmdB family regulatory protein
MPIFEYRCAGCAHEFELLVLRTSSTPVCPVCQSERLEKLISMSAVSSDQTRRLNRRGAEARRDSIRRDVAHEEHKRFHDHDH